MKLFFIVSFVAFVGCSQPDQWSAFVYPDINNIPGPEKSENYIIGNFKNFEECQVAAIGQVRANISTADKQGAYMCGLNCKKREDFGSLLVCDEKRK